MFGLMTVKAHKKALALATASDRERHTIDRELDCRALDAARSINASLMADIDAMTPDFKRGKAHREKAEAYNEARRQRRAGK